ncbi:MAG: hypothetical protein HQL94_08185, partial [Magnetococcales bacterium]|nr:hypothetical protein [Magnetococcales bacterium]
IAAMAIANSGMKGFNPGNRAVVLDIINDFILRRTSVSAQIHRARNDYIATYETLKRCLLWEQNPEMQRHYRLMESDIVTGAIYQSLVELFHLLADTHTLVICEIDNSEIVMTSLHQLDSDLPVQVRTLTEALTAKDRGECLYFTSMDSVRDALYNAGVSYGRIVTVTDLLQIYSPTPQ